MKMSYRLTASKPTLSVNVPWQSAAIVVDNPTGSPVLVRMGAPDIPSRTNSDLYIPAASSSSHAAEGRDFGLALGDPTLLTTGSSSLSGLFNTVVVTILDDTEKIPAYGSFSFLSLSLSDLTNGLVTYAGPVTSAPFDLGAWGGAVIFVSPTVGTGQAALVVSVSPDGVAFTTFGSWALWPGNPAVLILPRTLRYMRISFAVSGIAGEPAIGGSYAVRASIAEIFQEKFTPIGNGISKALVIPHLGSVSSFYVTQNLPSVALRWQGTAGNPLGEAIWYTGPTSAGPWSLVAFREQVMGGASASLFRSIGNLDTFLRVDILDTDVIAGGYTGTLTMSIAEDQELTSYLQNIYAALGDVGSGAPNVNQSIYHELDNIRLYEAAIWQENLLQTPDIDAIRVADQAIQAAIGAGNLTTLLNSIITDILATNTKLDSILAKMNVGLSMSTSAQLVVAAGAFFNFGALLVPTWYISGIEVWYSIGGALAQGFSVFIASGTGAVPVSTIAAVSGPQPEGSSGWIKLDGPNSGGFLIPAGHTNLWVFSSIANTFVTVLFGMRPP